MLLTLYHRNFYQRRKFWLYFFYFSYLSTGIYLSCGKQEPDTGKADSYAYDEKLVQCLENELEAYLVTESDDV